MDKSLMIDLNDERTGKVAEILANKSCRKILSLIAEKDMSAGDLAKKLGMQMNMVGYNIEKLKDAGLIESARDWWSVKGRKIQTYRISNRRIVIMPKKIFSGVLPALAITGILAFGIKLWEDSQKALVNYSAPVAGKVGGALQTTASEALGRVSGGSYGNQIYDTLANAPNSWAWFFLGALAALLILILWNLRRKL